MGDYHSPVPPFDEVNEQLNKAIDQEHRGRTYWPGMTYEQGVSAALRWMLGETEDKPMEDE